MTRLRANVASSRPCREALTLRAKVRHPSLSPDSSGLTLLDNGSRHPHAPAELDFLLSGGRRGRPDLFLCGANAAAACQSLQKRGLAERLGNESGFLWDRVERRCHGHGNRLPSAAHPRSRPRGSPPCAKQGILVRTCAAGEHFGFFSSAIRLVWLRASDFLAFRQRVGLPGQPRLVASTQHHRLRRRDGRIPLLCCDLDRPADPAFLESALKGSASPARGRAPDTLDSAVKPAAASRGQGVPEAATDSSEPAWPPSRQAQIETPPMDRRRFDFLNPVPWFRVRIFLQVIARGAFKEGAQLARTRGMPQLAQRFRLDLPDALAGGREGLADFLA